MNSKETIVVNYLSKEPYVLQMLYRFHMLSNQFNIVMNDCTDALTSEIVYVQYVHCLNTLHTYEFEGSAGFAKMQSIMQSFRTGIQTIGGKAVLETLDYAQGVDGLPKSDVLKFLLEDNCSVVVRPSGTEPKLKAYFSVCADCAQTAKAVENTMAEELKTYFA